MSKEIVERAELDKIKEGAADCEAEPVATPGAIQPHGVLLVLSPLYTILQVSNNVKQLLGVDTSALLDKPVQELLGNTQFRKLRDMVSREMKRDVDPYLRTLPNIPLSIAVKGEEKDFDGIVHRNEQQHFLLELEPRWLFEGFPEEDPYQLTKSSILRMQQAPDLSSLHDIIVHEIAALTGFDRVMVYQFDRDYHGDVVAEYLRENTFENSFLGLHFPNSDIPANARALYQKNWLRLTPDREYEPAGMSVADSWTLEEPLDMSQSVLRSVSHYHIEYLRTMKVGATMSISIFEGDQLWGLIACHKQQPGYLPYAIRNACEFIAQSLTLSLTQQQTRKVDIRNNDLDHLSRRMKSEISDRLSLDMLLKEQEEELLNLVDAQGFALIDSQALLLGVTPDQESVRELCKWLGAQIENRSGDIYHTNHLAEEYPPAQRYQSVASGVLAIIVEQPSPAYLIWFRQEEISIINWAGKPEKVVVEDERGIRFSSRKSFEVWQEKRKGYSLPWEMNDFQTVRQFRTRFYDLQSFVFKQFEQKNNLLEQKISERTRELEIANKQLSAEIAKKEQLQKHLNSNLKTIKAANDSLAQFVHIASHDLREPLRVVSNFSQMLERKNKEQLDDKGKKYLQYVQEGTQRMQRLIDALLKYSRIQKSTHAERKINTESALNEALSLLRSELEASQGEVEIKSPLPPIWGDRSLMVQLFQNLLSNALKYRDKEQKPQIRIWAVEDNHHFYRFYIADNGIGIEQEHHEVIFDLFKRLHASTEYIGTGIGLSICKKIVEKLGGEIGLTSTPGQGSTFYFTLPKTQNDE